MALEAIALGAFDRRALADACELLEDLDVVTETEDFVLEAQVQSGRLSPRLRRHLLDFRRFGHPSGALLVSGVPVGPLPTTPDRAEAGVGARGAGGAALSVLAACLGDQYGFRPELGGSVIQDILPVRGFERQQISVSSTADLEAHTETAFSPHRPDYVALLCLRPDHEHRAGTTVCSIDGMLPLLDTSTIEMLGEPRFNTGIDSSFVIGDETSEDTWVGPIRILDGPAWRRRLRVDFESTRGVDPAARHALDALRDAAVRTQTVVRLSAGDLLVLDNSRAVHGRTPFVPRYDGRDRWLLRSFIARDLRSSECHRPRDERIVQPTYATP